MLTQVDLALFAALNRGCGNRLFDAAMPVLTNLHHTRWFVWTIGLVAVAVLAAGSRRSRVWLLCLLVAVGLSDVTAARMWKRIMPRDRPCHTIAASGTMSFPETRLVGACPGSKSFPSNHASNTMAVAVVGWWFTTRKRLRAAWFLLPLAIGYSRIYLGYHYPSDVMGGWILGAMLAAATIAVVGRLDRRPPGVTSRAGSEPSSGA